MTSLSGSVAGLEGSHSLRRMSSMRRTFTSGQAGIKRNSLALQVKFQVDGLCEQLRRTKIHFVHCFLPQHHAGLCDVKSKAKSNTDEAHMNIPLVRSQVGFEYLSSGEKNTHLIFIRINIIFFLSFFPSRWEYSSYNSLFTKLFVPNKAHVNF